MEITPYIRKRLQEVGRALSETDVPLLICGDTVSRGEKDRYAVIEAKTTWAENEVQEWVAVSARRDHVYAHLRYTSDMVWRHFLQWARKQEEIYLGNPHRGFPSAAFAIDLFHLVEDARIERAWVLEYPGTESRLRYYNKKSADNIPFTEGIKAVITGLHYASLLNFIPFNLELSDEEISLIRRALPLAEMGKKAETTLEARGYAQKILKIFRSYLINNPEEYGHIPETPRTGLPQKDSVVPGAEDEPFSHNDNTGGFEDIAGDGRDNAAPDGEHHKDGDSDGDRDDERQPFDSDPENRSQALSTPGHGKREESSKNNENGNSETSSPQADAEEEYQQLLEGAERELKNTKYRADRSKLVIKYRREADKLEKGIHEHIVPLDLEPGHLKNYYYGDFEKLTPVFNIKNKHRKQIMNLSREIKEVLLYRKTLPERHLRKGWPDSGNLWKLVLGETTVFRKKNVQAAIPDISVMLLVDCSRSMRRNNRSEICKQSLVVAAEALERNRVRYAINGFTTGTQYNTVVNINYKNFDETGIDNLDYYSGFHENRDGYSIRRAVQIMDKRREKKKILIVLSDSVPNHTHVDRAEINYSFELGKGIKDTSLAIREAVRKGVIVVGIYFGDKAVVNRVRTVYPNFVYCEVLNLPRVLGSVLRRCLR